MHQGRIRREFTRDEASAETVAAAAMGAPGRLPAEAHA